LSILEALISVSASAKICLSLLASVEVGEASEAAEEFCPSWRSERSHHARQDTSKVISSSEAANEVLNLSEAASEVLDFSEAVNEVIYLFEHRGRCHILADRGRFSSLLLNFTIFSLSLYIYFAIAMYLLRTIFVQDSLFRCLYLTRSRYTVR
jgi:hypothetical protein